MGSFSGLLSGGDYYGGFNWMDPASWPATVRIDRMPSDYIYLFNQMFHPLVFQHLRNLKWELPLIRVKRAEVLPSDIEHEADDRDTDEETGEFSTAYVDKLQAEMVAGKPLPPLIVTDYDKSKRHPWGRVFDGRHRLYVAERLGLNILPAVDVTGFPLEHEKVTKWP